MLSAARAAAARAAPALAATGEPLHWAPAAWSAPRRCFGLAQPGEWPQPVPAAEAVKAVAPFDNIIVGISNAEPVSVMDAVEEATAVGALGGPKRVHQMHSLHPREYFRGANANLRHVSYFLSEHTRKHFAVGTLDFVPANLSKVPTVMRALPNAVVLACCSPPDEHGFMSTGVSCDYTGSMMGRMPFIVEVNKQMPRTMGRGQLHISQVLSITESDRPLVEVTPPEPGEKDTLIGNLVAERIPDGATLQCGIGGMPNAVLGALGGHRNLGVHTEVMSDGIMDLMVAGVVNNVEKQLVRTKTATSFALGTRKLYDFVDGNPVVEFLPVSWVNNPLFIGRLDNMVSINSTLEVDLMGQCASESLGHKLFSGTGGQSDFALGCQLSDGGQGFVVLHSTAKDDTVSRIVPSLHPGAMVSTSKNLVDKVVTEFGVAELKGRTVRDRVTALIDVAHPKFRDELTAHAKSIGYL